MDRRLDPQGPDIPTIVAVDFGTTHTGFAFILPDDNEPTSSRNWPARQEDHDIDPKTPTAVSISNDGDIIRYGYLTEPRDPTFSFFKPLLVPWHLLTERTRNFLGIQEAERLCRAHHRSAIDVTGHYLRATFRHFVDKVELSQEQQRGMELVMTVPAGWPDVMAANLKTALIQAEILTPASGHRVRVLREAHAALRAMISDAQDAEKFGQPVQFQNNDVIIGVEAGGLTLETVRARVTSVNPVKIELKSCHGEDYGLGHAKPAFVEYLRQVLTKADAPWPNEAELESFANKAWSKYVLKNYDGSNERSYYIQIPGTWEGKPNPRNVRIDDADITSHLDTAVAHVQRFINKQCKAARDLGEGIMGRSIIVLVSGGFAACKGLRAAVEDNPPANARVYFHPLNRSHLGWSAVARGAVMIAREAQSEARDPNRLGRLAAHRYGVITRGNGVRWIIEANKPPVPGFPIPLLPDDFTITTRPPVVQGDLDLKKIGRLVVFRSPPEGRPRTKAFEITVVGSVQGTELEVLGNTGIGVDVEFAVRRGGIRLGPEDAQVDYYNVGNNQG